MADDALTRTFEAYTEIGHRFGEAVTAYFERAGRAMTSLVEAFRQYWAAADGSGCVRVGHGFGKRVAEAAVCARFAGEYCRTAGVRTRFGRCSRKPSATGC
jgi:hypothetical protein